MKQKAVVDGAVGYNSFPRDYLSLSAREKHETRIQSALLAALPALTEGLDEVLAQISIDYSTAVDAYGSRTGPDPSHWTEFFANALVEKMKERIES